MTVILIHCAHVYVQETEDFIHSLCHAVIPVFLLSLHITGITSLNKIHCTPSVVVLQIHCRSNIHVRTLFLEIIIIINNDKILENIRNCRKK